MLYNINTMVCENLTYKINLKYYKPDDIYYRYFKLQLKDYQLVRTKNSYYIKTYRKDKIVKSRSDNLPNYSRRNYSFKLLKEKFSEKTIKKMINNKMIVLVPCGKCSSCLNNKKNIYHRRVKSCMKHTKYNYLLTITFSNNNIKCLLPESERQEILYLERQNKTLSYLSTLSKNDVKNIIKNIKNKLNRYYDDKVKINYILCGEYGENTKRAHYHILLMLDRQLPDLKKIAAQGNYYKCPLFETKQFGLYDLQLADNKENTARYITKYLTKTSSKYNTHKLNLFQEQQQKQLLLNGIRDGYLFKKEEYLEQDSDFYEINKNNLNVMVPVLTYQKEFIKMSRGLGITGDYYQDFYNGVLNKYYRLKMVNVFYRLYRIFNVLPYDSIQESYFKFIYYLYLEIIKLLSLIYMKRTNSINMYLFKVQYERKEYKKIKKVDIF